jgi:hypothetical protein
MVLTPSKRLIGFLTLMYRQSVAYLLRIPKISHLAIARAALSISAYSKKILLA